jgi:hypothetical protein
MSGTIEAVNASATGVMIQVSTQDNQTWYLQVKPMAKVKVTGKGNASSLVPGQNVNYSGSAGDKKGAATEKISKLSVILPQGQMGMGVGMGPNAGPGPKPGSKLGKNQGAADLVGADAGGSSDVTGVVSKVGKGNRVSLTVNGKKRTIELADDVEVSFNMEGPAALEFVGPGAKIEFKGKAMGNFPRAVVDDVTVEIVPGDSHPGKKLAHKPLHTKSKKGGDDLDAAADDDKPEPKKPAHHAHVKKPDAGDEKPADEKPADAGDAAAK